MALSRKDDEPVKPRRPPAKTPQGREDQLVSIAVDLAEKQMLEGTASAQVITHYLKIASPRHQHEIDKLVAENALLKAKVDDMALARGSEELLDRALRAFTTYQGREEAYDDFE